MGAFRYRENADELVQRLRARGVTPAVTRDGLYRVRVGRDLDRAAADRLAAELQAAGFETYVRVQR